MINMPLNGIRVLDLSRVLAGPWATQMLADLGAEVIKVEAPDKGDDTRSWGPPFLKDQKESIWSSAYYLAANRGKKSIAIDLATEDGQETIHALVKSCDVLVENFKIGGLEKFKLDYPHVKHMNPSIVYCSISGYGQSGPEAKLPGYDLAIQAKSGLMSITGNAEFSKSANTSTDSEPQKVGVAIADIVTGLYASNAIQAAIRYREKTGRGQHIDLALLDCMLACLANQSLNYLVSGQSPKRQGNVHPNIAPYQTVRAKDGEFVLAVGNDRQFKALCESLNLIQLTDSPSFSDNAARLKNRERLIELLESQLKAHSIDYWIELLESVNIPCARINSIGEAFESPQIKHREMAVSIPTEEGIDIPQVANPIKFSETPIRYHQAPPKMGEHNDEIAQLIKNGNAAKS